MLVAPALVLVWKLAVCDSYDYEYAQGDGDISYGSYIEEQATLHPGPDPGRVRRYGDVIRPLTTADSYDLNGAIMQILGERRPDKIANITSLDPVYIPEPSIFTPLPRNQYIKEFVPTLHNYIATYVGPVPSRSSLEPHSGIPQHIRNVETHYVAPVKKPQLDERGLQTIIEITEENTVSTQDVGEVTEDGEESTVPYQLTIEKVATGINSMITNTATGSELTDRNAINMYQTPEVDATNETVMFSTTDTTGDVFVKEITTFTNQISDGTELREEDNVHWDTMFLTEQIFTKIKEYDETLNVPQHLTPRYTLISPTSMDKRIKAKKLEEVGRMNWRYTPTIFGGNFTHEILRQDEETDEGETEEPTSTQNLTDTTQTTTEPTTTELKFDIEKFLEIIANLTYDYETNLTSQVNETLQKFSIPTCRTPTTVLATTPTTTTTTTTTEASEYTALNRTIIAKCFVCGLETPGIPYDADCADAFAGDFLPLVPQDPRAKGKIARFRKYCRYGEIHNYFFNASQPRSLFGRWTGGCSVRWTDLTGIYTQRSCRNRRRPTTGLHYASKRMAKLEAALSLVEQGCIVSPVATLLPLSRGISLFARFHACVCLGNWCNGGGPGPALHALLTALTLAAALQAV